MKKGGEKARVKDAIHSTRSDEGWQAQPVPSARLA
jgi:hypothetical protein